MLVAGATFTTLLLLLPAMYWAQWQGFPLPSGTMGLVAFPFGVALLATIKPTPWLCHFGFFAAHLPAIVVEPGLTGPEVYAGNRAALAVFALAAIGTAWVWTCRWTNNVSQADGSEATQSDPVDKTTHSSPNTTRSGVFAGQKLGIIAALGAILTYAAFVTAAFGQPQTVSPMAASMTLLVGLIVAWYVGAIQIGNRIGDVILDVRARRRVLASLFVERRRSKGDAWTTIVWLVAALMGALLWYLP